MEKNNTEKPGQELERIELQNIRGRIIILDPEKSEFAKNLKLQKRGDYQKKK